MSFINEWSSTIENYVLIFFFFLIFEREVEDLSVHLIRIKFIQFPDFYSLMICIETIAHPHPFDHKKCFLWKCRCDGTASWENKAEINMKVYFSSSVKPNGLIKDTVNGMKREGKMFNNSFSSTKSSKTLCFAVQIFFFWLWELN